MNFFVSIFFRITCILLIYTKLFENNIKTRKHLFPFAITLFTTCTLSQLYFQNYSTIISLLMNSLLITLFFSLQFKLSFLTTSITYTLFYLINNACSLLVIILCIPFYYITVSIPDILQILVTGSLSLLLSYYILKCKIVQTAKKSFRNKTVRNISILFCVLVLILKFLDYQDFALSESTFLPLATFLLAILLFTWWRRQITKSYIEKLRKLELQSLYDELTEKEEQIKKLTGDNEALSRIIHKDNKLIPAMEHLVSEFLSDNDFNNPEELKQYGNRLTKQLHDMTRDRRGILENYEHGNHKLKLTGHVALDAILVYMQKKAEDQNILFECKHNEDSLNYLLSKISEEDLSHLLSDFLENAIISMRETDNGRLQVVFGKLQKEAYIAIADTGSDFKLSTLHSFGISPNTTHENDGGSGIGLMDIWKLKRKYRATIQIQEYEKNSNTFTKRILFSFNSKNHYVIQSYRHTEISNNQTRGDLYVIPMDTVRKNEDKEYERNDQNLNS